MSWITGCILLCTCNAERQRERERISYLKIWFASVCRNYLRQVGKEFEKRYQKILERLESRIDPFDFDVFYPHLQTHLSRKMTRSNARLFCWYVLQWNVLKTFTITLTTGPKNPPEVNIEHVMHKVMYPAHPGWYQGPPYGTHDVHQAGQHVAKTAGNIVV